MMNSSINNNKCNLCGSSGPKLTLWTDNTLHAIQCKNCRVIYCHPLPTSEEVNRLYPKKYYQSYLDDIARRNAHTQGHFRRIQPWLNKPGRLLDLGCGIGYFANFARHLGWEVSGIEPSGWAAAYARDHFRINVFNGSLAKAHFPEKSFDLITLWDVLSHLDNPLDTLKEINRVLKDNGLILLRVPASNAFSFRFAWMMSFFGQSSQSIIHFPYQIYQFNPGSLKWLLSLSGFQEIAAHITRDLYVPSKKKALNWKGYLIKLLGLTGNGLSSRNTMLVLAGKG